jgi:hypothetical protein
MKSGQKTMWAMWARNLSPMSKIKPRFLGRSARSQVVKSKELSRLTLMSCKSVSSYTERTIAEIPSKNRTLCCYFLYLSLLSTPLSQFNLSLLTPSALSMSGLCKLTRSPVTLVDGAEHASSPLYRNPYVAEPLTF